MEPAKKSKLRKRTQWIIHTKVDCIKEKFTRRYNCGQSVALSLGELPEMKAGQFEDVSVGLYAKFEGSSESILL